MTHIVDLRAEFAAKQIGWVYPTYFIDEVEHTLSSRTCLGDLSAPHTTAPENTAALVGYMQVCHESGETIADFSQALQDKTKGDSAAIDTIVATHASWRTELHGCELSWECPDGELVVRDPKDDETVYTNTGVLVRDYFEAGKAKGKPQSELALALRELIGDSHSNPPDAPDSTHFDEIMA